MAEIDLLGKEAITLNMPIIVTQKNGQAQLELRRGVTDLETIKKLVECAFHSKTILILPSFTNKLKSISSLVDKGVLNLGKDGKYYFTF